MKTRDIHVDPLLTNIAIAYKNTKFIAREIFPSLDVAEDKGLYFVYDKSNLTPEDSKRDGYGRANRVERGLSQASYGPLQEHSLEYALEYKLLKKAKSPLQPRTNATNTLAEKLSIEQELALATTLAATGTITQNTTLSGADQWSDYINSTPFEDIEDGIASIEDNGLQTPNTAIIGASVWRKLKHHPDLLDRMAVTGLKVLTEQMLADLIGVDRIMIGKAKYNTAAEGQTASVSSIWGKHFWLAYITQTPDIESISAGYTLQLDGGIVIDGWDEPQNKAEMVRITDYYEQKLVAVEAIYLIKNAVA